MSAKPTRTLFRMFRGEVLALFPGLAGGVGRPWECLRSYAHVGQHGAAHLSRVMRDSRAATRAERAPLVRELRARGYRVKIAHRESRADCRARAKGVTS